MSPEDAAELHRRAKRVFLELIERPREDWERLLPELCDGDEDLLAEVSSLIANRGADTSHLAPEVVATGGSMPSEVSAALLEELARELCGDAGASLEGIGGGLRLEPGLRLADRYRMIRPLGAGGMGEVWAAEDLMLGETVALKFVRSRKQGSAWIERLLKETALARRISHPNVCRVHDAAEVEGKFFISMELVPGEDLAARLRHGGRYGRAESMRMARDLVDALAAIHAIGLLHRDLKPANILLDESGAPHVSDFGLAVASQDSSEGDSRSGTRAYMAPEQLRGQAPSEASDIYALGLILYEVVTNRRAFRSSEEILDAAAAGSLPPPPSRLVPDVDPLLELVVQSCLDPDPSARPSAAELREVLDSGDPLEAVLRLGREPTARIIAGSRSRPPLSPRRARALVLGFLLALLGAWLMVRHRGLSLMPETSPEERVQGARELLRDVGLPVASQPVFELGSYAIEPPIYERAGHRLALRPARASVERPFWFRSADRPLAPVTAISQLFGFGRVRPFDPPPGEPGSTTLILDSEGDLVFLDAWPDPRSDSAPEGGALGRLFELAGLNQADFEACDALPPRVVQADKQLAWTSIDSSMRVEAATSGGRVVAFEVLEPDAEALPEQSTADWFILLNTLLITGLWAASMPRALRHFRSGRGDLVIATRVAIATMASLLFAWMLYADYPRGAFERFVFWVSGLFMSFASGGLVWILSVAVEPGIQRLWPRIFVSWSRFHRGDLRDRGVRSDLLVGMCLGISVVALQPLIAGSATDYLYPSSLLRGFQPAEWLGSIVEVFPGAILLCLEFVVILAALGWALRNRKIAVAGTGVVACTIGGGAAESLPGTSLAILSMLLLLFCLMRYGLLAMFAMEVCRGVFEVSPLSASASSWYAGAAFLTASLMVALLLWIAWPLLRAQLGPPRASSA